MQFINSLTNPWNKDVKIHRQLELFARSLGWFPSDIVEESINTPCTGHIVVEHGLDNTAVISFINSNLHYHDLLTKDKNEILQVSYNNLVDLHIAVDNKTVTAVHNRLDYATQEIYRGDLEDSGENLRSDFFDELLRKQKISPNIKSLDDAFIETISYWKRIIHADLSYQVNNEQISNLFNALIFIRAIEDTFNRKENIAAAVPRLVSNLLNQDDIILSSILTKTLSDLQIKEWPEYLIDLESIKIFDSKIHYSQVYKLFGDFYTNKFAPYSYDFSIISKHALSRIYERYVSILKIEDSSQTSLFPRIAEEEANKLAGSYYTPQFIARFFTRYISQIKGNAFNKPVRVLEPAVGSGIFLRTFLEYQLNENFQTEIISAIFSNVEGVDIDRTACNAARLSLSLLFLSASGNLPGSDLINIHNGDSLEFINNNRYDENIDFFISNPPFVAYKNLTDDDRQNLFSYLGEVGTGKPDLYFAFILMSIKVLRPGGTALLVLPNTFLISESAKPIRNMLFKEGFVKCIVDLSNHNIFPNAGVYPILLIFEKVNLEMRERSEVYNSKPFAYVAIIQDSIGKALSDVLNKRIIESASYSIYEVNQEYFDTPEWYLYPPSQYSLIRKLSSLRKLNEFLEVRTGFATGSTEAFIVKKSEIPKGENGIYTPYLSDREMSKFNSPKDVRTYLFYPFVDGVKLTSRNFKAKYPKSFERLSKYRKVLRKRKEVEEGRIEWWEPNRPRDPSFMLVPKIVTPHLVFSPKFSLDLKGSFAISRAPFLAVREGVNDDMLFYILAVLNSRVCFWYMLSRTAKYQHGYAMLEKKSLVELPIPDPDEIDNKILIIDLISLVKKRIRAQGDAAAELELRIEEQVAKLYNLSEGELKFLNF
ncbi:MAG TPA: N-6 DNA methylase [Cyclobacteriaceae bacterium]|mgnify:CR=1 FL=1|nr:N-6 DNA methylase [Cyclobacteriaceae bacterium]